MQLRPEIELIEVSGRSLRIIDAHLITADGPARPIGHDLPDRGVELTAGPSGYTARWSRGSVSLPGIARAFVGGAAGGALFRLLGLPGAVLGAVIAVGLARTARERPAAAVPDPTVSVVEDGPDLVLHSADLPALVFAVMELTGATDPVTVSPAAAAAELPDGGSESVRLDDVGGLEDVVAQFRDVAVSFRHPEVMARWGATRPQGILLYGPPGTGKTMLARALANEIGGELREIRTPEILDKWVGNSEKNIQRIFADARRLRHPTVLLFDEFDSIISYTGAAFDAAGQMINAVAGIFKQEMNTLIEHNPNVIVVATTNFPDRVDASLIRSGRFDLKLSVPPPGPQARADILTKLLRRLISRHEVGGFRLFADDVDVTALAAASTGMTGADFKEALRRAQLDKAMHEARHGTPPSPITQADLLAAIRAVRV
ncbi:AAA family ATPase [Dactylosporangium aurantiacum]|uniref:AAA family ATPase n=1 Tax=Dactylosporangium aurantiacum TaxID=35754 RepID=A0A9Q9IP59_9ACTN|nr:AAA family ATPase [Dactylosporangium aurantiacum]MDG6104288.1 AAA family ATPase [Dactylosporangium aurantiacum]UWZ56715.1 AAA family ATPase [Dactylosporangium aurantiacum]